MSRPPTLTPAQMAWIDAHPDMFPAQIRDHADFPPPEVSRHVIRGYQTRPRDERATQHEAATVRHANETEDLVNRLLQHISKNGLPSRFHGRDGVPGYIEHLKERV